MVKIIAIQSMEHNTWVRPAPRLAELTAGPEARSTKLFGVNCHPAAQYVLRCLEAISK